MGKRIASQTQKIGYKQFGVYKRKAKPKAKVSAKLKS
ncbi:hypothetical protein P700755_002360 [Psychroflexus torquis ATCC 700755]|jgi:hypothetical protein|uniref:Uncharacterized protein n=1 Tax=Psychroflexus torquis (strain ATCC 700755 / CIP 106069 / ACAM 623) TaxID=313595 RepID=K4IF16_PSYTT|nr:hypothetical protein P700755_002360 [Psychroflexus torquis ATCC 700755]